MIRFVHWHNIHWPFFGYSSTIEANYTPLCFSIFLSLRVFVVVVVALFSVLKIARKYNHSVATKVWRFIVPGKYDDNDGRCVATTMNFAGEKTQNTTDMAKVDIHPALAKSMTLQSNWEKYTHKHDTLSMSAVSDGISSSCIILSIFLFCAPENAFMVQSCGKITNCFWLDAFIRQCSATFSICCCCCCQTMHRFQLNLLFN